MEFIKNILKIIFTLFDFAVEAPKNLAKAVGQLIRITTITSIGLLFSAVIVGQYTGYSIEPVVRFIAIFALITSIIAFMYATKEIVALLAVPATRDETKMILWKLVIPAYIYIWTVALLLLFLPIDNATPIGLLIVIVAVALIGMTGFVLNDSPENAFRIIQGGAFIIITVAGFSLFLPGVAKDIYQFVYLGSNEKLETISSTPIGAWLIFLGFLGLGFFVYKKFWAKNTVLKSNQKTIVDSKSTGWIWTVIVLVVIWFFLAQKFPTQLSSPWVKFQNALNDLDITTKQKGGFETFYTPNGDSIWVLEKGDIITLDAPANDGYRYSVAFISKNLWCEITLYTKNSRNIKVHEYTFDDTYSMGFLYDAHRTMYLEVDKRTEIRITRQLLVRNINSGENDATEPDTANPVTTETPTKLKPATAQTNSETQQTTDKATADSGWVYETNTDGKKNFAIGNLKTGPIHTFTVENGPYEVKINTLSEEPLTFIVVKEGKQKITSNNITLVIKSKTIVYSNEVAVITIKKRSL